MPTSIREIARHIEPHPPTLLSVRTIFKDQTYNFRLNLQSAPFSVMCHNMGLMVAPAKYLGTDRQGAINEIINQIQILSPDIVGLCEVFADAERLDIYNRLKHIYPYFQEGPEKNALSDGGLLLLSKYFFIQAHQIVFSYDDCSGVDCHADKGVIHIRVKSTTSPMAYDIFFSHMQNIKEDGLGGKGAGRNALLKQLIAMNNMIQKYSDPSIPTLIMGDLNIPGEVPNDYNELLARLKKTVDFWVVNGNDENSGFTFIADNNFYKDPSENPLLNTRLDYVLLKPGVNFIPILENIEILKFKHQGRYISDHFGLHAKVKDLVQIDN